MWLKNPLQIPPVFTDLLMLLGLPRTRFTVFVLCSFPGEENVIAVPLGSRSVRITLKGPAHLCKYNLILTCFYFLIVYVAKTKIFHCVLRSVGKRLKDFANHSEIVSITRE